MVYFSGALPEHHDERLLLIQAIQQRVDWAVRVIAMSL